MNTISELVSLGISRSLVRRHLPYLIEQGWARRCSPGRGSSPWLIDDHAIPYLKQRVGHRGRYRIRFSREATHNALLVWEETHKIVRVARVLNVSACTARSFLERRGKLEKKKRKDISKDGNPAPILRKPDS